MRQGRGICGFLRPRQLSGWRQRALPPVRCLAWRVLRRSCTSLTSCCQAGQLRSSGNWSVETDELCGAALRRRPFLLCSRQESNLHQRLRKPPSYPLNDESSSCERANDTTSERFLEPKPDCHEVGDRVVVGVLLYPLKEVEIDRLAINVLKGDHEVGREPALGLYRE